MSCISRRAVLLGAGATVVVSALPKYAYAQNVPAGTNTKLQLSSGGLIVIPPSVGSVALNPAERMTLGQIATELWKKGMSRSDANMTMSAIVRAFCTYSANKGPLGVALAAGVGGAYNLATTGGLSGGVIDFAAGNQAIQLMSPQCAGVAIQGGSYPSSITMGWHKQNETCSNGFVHFRMSVLNYDGNTGSGKPAGSTAWNWAYTQSLGAGKYRHFYIANFPTAQPTTLSAGFVSGSGGDVEFHKSLPQAMLDAPVDPNLMAAVRYGLQKWAAGQPDYRNYGGVFDAYQGNGQWQPATAAGAAKSPGSGPEPSSSYYGDVPTLGQLLAPPDASRTIDPGNVEFPREAVFPGEPGSSTTPTPTPTPGATPTPTPTPGTGSGGGSTDPDKGPDWTSWLPSMPDLGLPSLPEMPDLGLPEMPEFSLPTITLPAIAATCIDPALNFTLPFPAMIGGDRPYAGSLPICELAKPAADFFKPIMTSLAYPVAAWRALRKLS